MERDGIFTSTASGTDLLDWVILELRSGTTPATVISRRAAFVRCDGKIVDLDGTSDVSFNNVASDNYHLVIRHRNHLPVGTSITTALDASLGAIAPALYDFSTAQAKAYQQTIPPLLNAAMKSFGSGVFGMWGGNVNQNNVVNFTGNFPSGQGNDAGSLLTCIGR